ncbi:SOS response-associated peptidase family protein [Virgifigura deserti]|uniref:SOS response-associated peptidase family protein n=1 Tax=Virgifigura deserti TaxID=2268457 RepID=UPI003CCBBB75
MCGRYSITSPTEAVRRVFGVPELSNLEPRHNVAPTQPKPVVRLDWGKSPRSGAISRALVKPAPSDRLPPRMTPQSMGSPRWPMPHSVLRRR